MADDCDLGARRWLRDEFWFFAFGVGFRLGSCGFCTVFVVFGDFWLREFFVERMLDQRIDAVTLRRRNCVRVANTQLVELGSHARVVHAFGFVDRKVHGQPATTQQISDARILWRNACTAVDDKENDVGFIERLQRLPRHFLQDAVFSHGLEATGIDDDEAMVADAALAILAITRETGEVGNQRRARTRESVEERALSDVRTSDEGDGGKHFLFLFLSVSTRADAAV